MASLEDKIIELENIIKEKDKEIHRLKSIIDNVPGSIYWKDKNGTYLGRNQFSAESLKSMGFLWREEDIIGKSDYDLFDKEMADQFRAHDLHVMNSRISSSHEEKVPLQDKTIVQLSTKAPLFDQEGKVEGIVGNTVDITYLKDVEKRLIEAKEEAETANTAELELRKAVTILAGSIVHDLKTPIAILQMDESIINKSLPILLNIYDLAKAAGLLSLENTISERRLIKLRNIESSIRKTSQQMGEFIDATLKTLSRVLKGEPTQQDLSVCSMWHCIHNTLLRYPMLEEQRDSIKWDQQDFSFMGNEILMIRIIMNLLTNSLQQIIKNGRGEIFISTEKNEKINILRFSDTAGGVIPEAIAHLFDGYHTTKEKGTGIGLAFCKLVMQNFGGNIDCHVLKGNYIEFELRFPTLL